MTSLLWDQHTCLPLRTDTEVDPLTRYKRRAGAFVSVNAGYSPHTLNDTISLLRHYRAAVAAHPDLELADNLDDVDAITRAGRIAVVFDLEDSGPLDGDLSNLATFVGLGVRTLLPTYNHANRAGSGCLDAIDGGLTGWGHEIVVEMNHLGIVPDGSHCSARTGLDMCEVSSGPVIYSHSCMRAVWDHPRNVTDDQARACASTGGVIGITGVGIFLGPNTPPSTRWHDTWNTPSSSSVSTMSVSARTSHSISLISTTNSPATRTCLTTAIPAGDPSSGCSPKPS